MGFADPAAGDGEAGADAAAVGEAAADGAAVGSSAALAETNEKTASAHAAVDKMKRIMRPRFDAP